MQTERWRQVLAMFSEINPRELTAFQTGVVMAERRYGMFTPASAVRPPELPPPEEGYYMPPARGRQQLPVDITNAGRSCWLRGDTFVRSESQLFALELVTGGKGELTVKKRRYELLANDVFVLHPNEAHRYRATSLKPFEKMYVGIAVATALQRTLLERLGLLQTSHIRLDSATAHAARALITEIIRALQAAKPPARARLSALAYQLLVTIAEAYAPPPAPLALPDGVEAAMRHVLTHLTEPVRVATLASKTGYSPDHLNRVFVKYVGMRAHAWIENTKLLAASRLLNKTRLKVHEVAECLGYDNSYVFIRVFKRQTGMTPEVFRRRVWDRRRAPRADATTTATETRGRGRRA